MSLRRKNNPYESQFKNSDIINRFLSENKFVNNAPSNMETVYNAESKTPLLGTNTGLGESSYDEDLNWYSHIDENDPQDSINEYRAQKQSAWDQLGAGLGRTAVKAAVETSKLPGIIGGLVGGIAGQINDASTGEDNTNFIDTVFNNGWIKGLDSINEEIKSEYLPVYVKKAVRDGDLGDKIMSSAFWATDGADGAGFALGMILPGAMLGKLGLGAKMIGAANRMDKARELFAGAERAEEFVKAANKIGATARNIDSGISIGYNTAAEAGAEATQAGTETRANEGKIVNGWKASGYLNTPEYQIEAKKYIQSLDVKRRNGHLTMDQQNELTSDPLKVQEAVLHQRFENEVTSMQSSIFGRNVAILLGPNTLMHMQLFGRIGRSAEKIAEKGAVETVENVGRMSKILNSSIGKGVTKFGERVAKNTLSEGFFEEGLQTSTANQFKKYVAENRAEEVGFGDTIPDTFTEYAKMLGTTEGQVSVMLGGVLGTGMTSIAAHGQAKREAKIKNEITNRLSIPMNNLNNIFNINDIYKKDENGAIVYKKDAQGNPTTEPDIDLVKSQEVLRSLILTDDKLNRYKEAVDNGDNSYLDEQQSNAMFQLAKTAAYNGEKGLSLLKEQLDANSQLTDIQERDKNNDGSKKTYKQIVDETMETAKFLQKQNDKFQDFSSTIIKLNDERLDDPSKAKIYRTAFLNELNSRYLNVQNKLRFNKAKLEQLNKKRNDIFEELGIDPLYMSEAESPLIKMKSGIVSNEDINTRAKKTKEAIDSNELVKQVEEEYNKVSKDIEKNNKDISEVWKGNIVDKSFKDFVGDYLEVEEEANEDSLQNHQDVVDTINSFEDKASLVEYLKGLDQKFRDNDFIQNEFKDRYAYIGEQDKIKEELKRVEELEAESQKFEEDELVGTDTTPETTETVIDNDNNNGLETSQTSDNKEVDENGEVFDKDPSKENNLDDSTNPLKVAKNQGAARIISTNQQTGEALYPNLKAFVEFEKIPRDKTNDKVTFEVGAINPKDQTFTANAILDRVKKGEAITEDEITYLAKYLPIKVTITNGKDSASSFIDSMTSKSNKIVEVETLPLRKSIVEALIANKGNFKSIEGKVAKQFTGTLKLGEQNSNVLELDVFKGMTPEEKIQYFKKNTVYVSNKGDVKYCSSDLIDETTSLSASNRGEVFLKIPMINGKMFYLKLNTARLSEEKAQDVLSLITLKSNLIKDKKEFTFEDLQAYIDNDLPFVKNEFEFIKRNNDSIDVNLDRLINFIIFSQNTNAKTKLMLNKDGSFTVGELIHKVNNILGLEGSKGYTYTTDKLNNLSDGERAALVKYFEYKRHNVLITKDDTATFNNDDYVNYLLGINSDYAILTTNAVVNEPTFQGYSNIYLNQAVVDKNAKKVIPAEETEEIDLDNPEDLLASLTGNYGGIETETIKVETQQQVEVEKVAEPVSGEITQNQEVSPEVADIEKRRQEELENKEAHYLIPIGVDLNLRENKKLLERKRIKDEINAKYDAELKALKPKVSPVKDVVKNNKLDQINLLESKLKGIINTSGDFTTYPKEFFEYLNLIFKPGFTGDKSAQFDLRTINDIYPGYLMDSNFSKVIESVKKTNSYQGMLLSINKNNENFSKTNVVEDVVATSVDKQIADLETERQKELKTAKIKLPVLDLSASENPEQYPKEAAENDRKIEEWKKLPSIINSRYDEQINALKGITTTEVKTIKSNNLQEVFKAADAKTKAKIVTVMAKQLGLMDKVNPKDMNSSFNELYSNLKDNESLEKEIEKICGI